MNEIFIHIFTTIGALIVALWAVAKLVFPKYMDVYIKRIEHVQNREIKVLEANLHSEFEALKTSVDVAQKIEAELQRKRIEAIENLWQEIIRLKREFAALVAIEDLLTEEELYQAFQNSGENKNDKIDEIVKDYSTYEQITNKLDNIAAGYPGGHIAIGSATVPYPAENSRLFVDEDIYRMYETIVAIYGRLAYLLTQKPLEGKRLNWKDDLLIQNIIEKGLKKAGAWESIKNQTESMHALVNIFYLQFIYKVEETIHGTEGLTYRTMEIQQIIDESKARTKNTQLMRYNF